MQINMSRESLVTPLEVKILKHAAEFFANILLGSRLSKSIILDIEFKPSSYGAKGELVNEDGTNRSRWFTIGIRSDIEFDDKLMTLAHEMVHLKQHARNEVTYKQVRMKRGSKTVLTEIQLWQGKEWKPGRNEDEYFDAPWEIEAYGREQGLVHRFLTSGKSVVHK